MSKPDMCYPILNALSFPQMNKYPFKKLNLWEQKLLTFQKPDFNKFPLLKYAYEIGKKGGNLPAAVCIADDIVVHKFLNKQIKFHQIYAGIKSIVSRIKYVDNPDLDYIFWLEDYMKQKFQ